MYINLSKRDTNIIKGIAILMIVAHNYFHGLIPKPGENEMWFSRAFFTMISMIMANPMDFFRPFISFFGHYGVHIFIFLSGYGLTKKLGYIANLELLSTKEKLILIYKFIWKQLLKLLRLIIIGTTVWLIYRFLLNGYIPSLQFVKQLGRFLLFAQNLMPGKLYQFYSVWWFLSLLVQLYLIFPVLYIFFLKHARIAAVLMFLLLLLSASVYKPLLAYKIYVYATPLPNVSIFGLGIWCALGKEVSSNLIMMSFAILLPSFIWVHAFYFSFVSVVISFLYLYTKFQNDIINNTCILWIGEISMYIYIVHGNLRWHLFKIVNSVKDMYFSYVVFGGYLLEVIIIAFVCSLVMKKIENLIKIKKCHL